MEHVLLLQSGGMRGANTAGILAGAELEPQMFRYIVANSSGAANAAFFAAGQSTEEYKSCWTEHMPTERFVGWRNILRVGTFMNLDYVRDRVFSRLDLRGLDHSHCEVHVGLMRVRIGDEVYVRLLSSNAMELLSATCSLPFFARAVPVRYDGIIESMKDGAVTSPLPIHKAVEFAHLSGGKILVIMTRPKGGTLLPYSKLELVLAQQLYPNAYPAFMDRVWRYESALEQASSRGDVMIVYPDEEPEGGRFHTDPSMARRNFDRGFAKGRDMAAEIRAFLRG